MDLETLPGQRAQLESKLEDLVQRFGRARSNRTKCLLMCEMNGAIFALGMAIRLDPVRMADAESERIDALMEKVAAVEARCLREDAN